jgi:hypothetical protein
MCFRRRFGLLDALRKNQYHFRGRQEHTVTGATRQKFDRRIALSLVGLEMYWQVRVAFAPSVRDRLQAGCRAVGRGR